MFKYNFIYYVRRKDVCLKEIKLFKNIFDEFKCRKCIYISLKKIILVK